MEVFSCSLYFKLFFVFIFLLNRVGAVNVRNVTTEVTTESTVTTGSTATTESTIRTRSNETSESTVTTTNNDNSTTAQITTTNPTTSTENTTTTTANTTTTTAITTTTPDYTTTTIAPSCEPLVFGNVIIRGVGKTQVNVTINLTSPNQELICNQTDISVYCTALEDRPWVKDTNYTLDVTNQSWIYFELTNLSEFTNYSCEFEVLGSNSSYNITFTTKQDVPSEPTNLTFTRVTSSEFSFSWNDPVKIPTVLQGYNGTITRGDVSSKNHYWSHCDDEPNNWYAFSNTTPENYSIDFKEGLPDFDYTVAIWARSKAGFGIPANKSVTTKIAASQPPQNVSYNVDEDEFEKNINMAVLLSWNMPCNTNGPVNYFVIEMSGFYQMDQSIVQNTTFNMTIDVSKRYNYIIPELMAASNYSVQIYAANDTISNFSGIPAILEFSTDDNYPSLPEDVNVVERAAHNFTITWSEPSNRPGDITNYEIVVSFQEFSWPIIGSCSVKAPETRNYNSSELEYLVPEIIPGTTYDVAISAETSRGKGNPERLTVTSTMYDPEMANINITIDQPPTDGDEYSASAIIEIIPGCFFGEFKSYNISFRGTRAENTDHVGYVSTFDYTNCIHSFFLQPEFSYEVYVTIENAEFTSIQYGNFTSPTGVPIIDENSILNIEPITTSSEATLTLSREYFSGVQGVIRYFAILVSDRNETGGEIGNWSNTYEWPMPKEIGLYYQATPKFWEPFSDTIDVVNYTIGENQSCTAEFDPPCNRPLEPGKTYYVFVRLFNNRYYRNTMPITFRTDPLSRLGLILGIIFGTLAASTVGFVGFILWRKGIIKNFLTKEESDPKTEIAKEKFIEYCDYLERNPEELTKQWSDLQLESDKIYKDLENNFALLPENKRKNRFTNILPFDHTRVKLNIDEDDEICSDYINASFIKGISNENEYIATQGPLLHTVRDFWKMVFQENVSVIVMVARFIENKRDKCYKYFPNNHETLLVGDDIEVRCSTELHFQIYCVRTLQVRKDVKQITITHMQFLEWPDFGVPQGTEDLLFFCHQFRERWANEGGKAVVHCSAGVGRTGTIISTDIIMRTIEAGKKIDVFNTVLELRKQRRCMVQTERQYLYIHQLIKSTLESPITDEDDNSEHLYQNIELPTTGIRSGLVESAL